MNTSFPGFATSPGQPVMRPVMPTDQMPVAEGAALRQRSHNGIQFLEWNLMNPPSFPFFGAVNRGLVLKLGRGGFLALNSPDGISPLDTYLHCGGNLRGAGSVDLQVFPFTATEVASGSGSFCAGHRNTASNEYSVGIGVVNVSSGYYASIAMGYGNTCSGSYGGLALGRQNTCSGDGSVAIGFNANVNKTGQMSFGGGQFSASGDAQATKLLARASLTGSSPTKLTLHGSTNLTIPANTTWGGIARFVARTSTAAGTIESAVQVRRFLLTRGSSVGSTTLVASATEGTDLASGGAAAWAPTLSADTTNGALNLEYTAASGVRVLCEVEATEIGYP